MIKSDASMAQQIAQAAIAFERRRTGHTPTSVTVVMSDNTLMITLHGALSPAELALAKSPAGAPRCRIFHRQLFSSSLPIRGARKSKESPGSRCAKRSRKSNRPPALSCKRSPPAQSCRCSCSPVMYQLKRGVELERLFRFENGGSSHARFDKEMPRNGCGWRGRRFRAHAESHRVGNR